MPTPAQLNARIERHLGEESAPTAPPDASQALVRRARRAAPVFGLVHSPIVSASIEMLVEPSPARAGPPTTVISATIMPGMLNSASSRPSHSRSTTSLEFGRRDAQVELVAFADERQRLPVDRPHIGKQNPIPRDLGASDQRAQQRRGGGRHRDFHHVRRLQIGADPRDCLGTRIAAVAKIEDETRIANRFSAESGRSHVTLAKKFFYLSEQMHGVIPYSLMRLGGSFLPNAIPTCLGTFLSLKASINVVRPAPCP